MRTTQLLIRSLVASAACLCVVATTAVAAPINIANGTSVIGGNSDYPNGNFNTGGTYQTQNVTNGQNASPDNNTGSITEPGQDGSFWLGRDNSSAGYFVLDLLNPASIASFQLFNTRNGPYDDRGTGNFSITGSNVITNLGASPGAGFDIVGGTVLASGTLTNQTYAGGFGAQGSTPLVSDSFNSSDTVGTYRYLRFDALSIGAAADKGFGPAGVGLNEIRVFAVPEPASLTIVALGGIGLLARRRRA